MPIESHLRPGTLLRGLAFAAAVMLSAPALAQDSAQPGKPARSWIDPPVHGGAASANMPANPPQAHAPQAKAGESVAAPGPSNRASAAASPSTRQVAEERGIPQSHPSARVAPHSVRTPVKTLRKIPAVRLASAQVRTRTAMRRPADSERHVRIAAFGHPLAAPRNRGLRMAALRPVPAERYAPPPRDGAFVLMRPAPGFPGAYADDRDRRIRLAREAGYVLIRARTYELPDGRRFQSFRPDDSDD